MVAIGFSAVSVADIDPARHIPQWRRIPINHVKMQRN